MIWKKSNISRYFKGFSFHKNWHEELIYNLRLLSFSGDLLSLLLDFLTISKQRVVLSGQNLSWADTKRAGVPQEFILGPLYFFLYKDDLKEHLDLNPKLFTDGRSSFPYPIMQHSQLLIKLQFNPFITKINNWAYKWKMSFNPDYRLNAKYL